MANLGLVADYGSSSEEGLDSGQEDDCLKGVMVTGSPPKIEESLNYFKSIFDDPEPPVVAEAPKPKEKKKLANPLRTTSKKKKLKIDPSISVFYNPFQKEQEAKNSVLERHVKLTTNPKNVLEINGKKVCWNYRKGRCKFGHKCKFAHDSDLEGSSFVGSKDKSNLPPESQQHYGSNNAIIPQEAEERRKRKPGLSEGLIPNKRSRNMYKNVQGKEAPWLNKG